MKNNNPLIRILIADDHRLFRAGVVAALSQYDDLVIVGEAANGVSAVHQACFLKPDVIVMNLSMPEMDGIQATQQIRKQQLPSKVIILTGIDTGESVHAALKGGAQGYLLKDSSLEELHSAIHTVHKGKPVFSPSIAMDTLVELISGNAATTDLNPLTRREIDILKLVATGKSNKNIAHTLNISNATVNTHMNNILAKLDVENRVQATLYALRNGVVKL